jgi:hypothetical protein
MNRSDVTREQARKIERGLTPGLVFLFRLGRRMEQVGFPRDDELYQLMSAAQDAVGRLARHVNDMIYGGVGEQPRRGGHPPPKVE